MYDAEHSKKQVLCDNLEDWGIQDGGDTWIPMADSYWCMAKTITILLCLLKVINLQ